MYNSVLSITNTSLNWSLPSSVVLIAKQRLLVTNYKSLLDPDLTCRFVHAKRRDEHQNYKSLWVPALIGGFCMQNSDFWSRITSLCGSQASPVVLCMEYRVICTGMTGLYEFQPSSVVLCSQNSNFRTRHTSLCGSQPSPVVLNMENSVIIS